MVLIQQVCFDLLIEIVLIQEPCSSEGRIRGLRRHVRVVAGHNCYLGQLLLYFHRLSRFFLLDHLSESHCVCVELSYNGFSFYAVSTYRQPYIAIDIHIQTLYTIINQLRTTSKKIINDGDFDSCATNDWGMVLEDFICQNDLFIQNNRDDIPTFKSPAGSSYIDITVSLGLGAADFIDWRISSADTLRP